MSAPLVRLQSVGKSFGGTRALRSVDLAILAGEVHALIGENGAGKSTVGKIIGGYHAIDEGVIEVNGTVVERWSPRLALRNGIAMIHQELQLVPQLTVEQNVFLGAETNWFGVAVGPERARFAALDAKCGFRLDPKATLGDLRIAEQQKVEIMRAIARDARLIVMDEPASSLTADEVERLHGVIAWLRKEGRAVIYVTHKLEHVFAICDRVTIMREGARVRTANVAEETRLSLVEAMIGAAADVAMPARPPRPDLAVRPLLEARDLTTSSGLSQVSFVVRPGEIVGLVGLVGSGRTETARAIFGANPLVSGEIVFDGEAYRNPSPARSVARGIAFVPEDRRKQGLDLTQAVRPNMTAVHSVLVSRKGIVNRRREYSLVKTMISRLGIRPSDPDGLVAFYSGGNQQKVLLARWTLAPPRLAIFDEPSRGVDLGARRRIHEFIVEIAQAGAGVLLISSELEEVLGLSHRGYLLSGGRLIGEVDCETTTESEALHRLFGVEMRSDVREHDAGKVPPSTADGLN